jgi:DNA-binding MarR family transcriptional regulator
MTTDLEQLGRALKRAQHRQHRALEAALVRIDTTVVQWDALRAISLSPGASAHALAIATFQTDQAFGTLANRLAAQGMIERKPGGGRRIEHRLTVVGAQTLAQANTIATKVRADLFTPLPEMERHELRRILAQLLEGEPDPIGQDSEPGLHSEERSREPVGTKPISPD